MDGQTDRQIDRWNKEWMDSPMDGKNGYQTDEWKGTKDGWTERTMYGWMDGIIDGTTD